MDRDLDFRPESYWDPADPVTAITQNIKGDLRREAVRAVLEGDAEPPGGLDDESLADVLTDERRDALAGVHPWLMGGEYLPDYGRGEVEIARIVLASTTCDVIAIRARRSKDRIRYRVVDEYETPYSFRPRTSRRPLTFGELVGLIASLEGEDSEGGGLYLDRIRDMNVDGGADVDEMVHFITVSSPFYPGLEAYYDRQAEEWATRARAQLGEEEDDDEEGEEDEEERDGAEG